MLFLPVFLLVFVKLWEGIRGGKRHLENAIFYRTHRHVIFYFSGISFRCYHGHKKARM